MSRRKRMLQQLDDEIREHIETETRDNIGRGMSPEEARYAAMRKFGNVTRVKEETREVWSFVWLEQLLQDIRFGLRMLRKSPGFAAVAILTLALGIGANTAIFSVMNALLLKTLPVQNPEQLVIFDPIFQGHSSNGLTSYGVYERLRGLSAFFSGIAGIANVDRSNVTVNGLGGGANPEQVRVGLATGNYFETMGVNAVTGRTFGPEDDRVPGGHPVTVISHAYWERKFSLDPGIVGRTLRLNGTTYTILGVTARDFSGEWVGRPTDLWIPLTMVAQVMVELPPDLTHGAAMNVRIQVLARLKPGAQVGQAQAAAKAIHQQFWRDIDGPNLSAQDLDRIAHTDVELLPAARGYSPRRRDLAQPLAIVAMMVGLVLLIACANFANLLLVRSATRHREISVRQAVGAGAARIVRQLLTESVLLAAIGGALGLVFAGWVTSALMKFAAAGPVRGVQPGMTLELHLDGRVLAFTSLLCLLTGILFGLAPALRTAKASISPTLSERSASALGASGRLGRVLVISQVAASLLLLIVAGLFVQTVSNLKSQDLGFDRARVLLLWIAPGQTGRWGAANASLYQKVEERISSLPGVLAVSPSVYGMLQGNLTPGTILDVPGYVPGSDADARAQWSIVGRGFFDTLGLQLIAGRNFTEYDTTTAPPVAIINETMASHFFGHENPLGKHFQSWGVTKQIVGVVKDAKYESPREEGKRMFYLPYSQQLERLSQTICVAVRTEGPPASFALRIRQTLRDLDPNLPVLRTETIDDQLDELLVPERLMATLAGLFGALAALLACLGLYGVIAYGVSRRRNEIGVRMALGAQRGDVLGTVLKESLSLLIVGIAIGLPMTLGAARMISSRLFGVSAADPVTIVGASGLMLAVGTLAGLLPAYRASRLDPMVALRHE
jgi:predicted permease